MNHWYWTGLWNCFQKELYVTQVNHWKNVNSYPLANLANKYQPGMMKANMCVLQTCEISPFLNCCSFSMVGQVTRLVRVTKQMLAIDYCCSFWLTVEIEEYCPYHPMSKTNYAQLWHSWDMNFVIFGRIDHSGTSINQTNKCVHLRFKLCRVLSRIIQSQPVCSCSLWESLSLRLYYCKISVAWLRDMYCNWHIAEDEKLLIENA